MVLAPWGPFGSSPTGGRRQRRAFLARGSGARRSVLRRADPAQPSAAAISSTADAPSINGQSLNQITPVRAPVMAVSVPSATRTEADTPYAATAALWPVPAAVTEITKAAIPHIVIASATHSWRIT